MHFWFWSWVLDAAHKLRGWLTMQHHVFTVLACAGGGAILAVLSPGLSGLCLAIFTTLWGFTIIYGSYSRHSQRVVQVRGGIGHAAGTSAKAL